MAGGFDSFMQQHWGGLQARGPAAVDSFVQAHWGGIQGFPAPTPAQGGVDSFLGQYFGGAQGEGDAPRISLSLIHQIEAETLAGLAFTGAGIGGVDSFLGQQWGGIQALREPITANALVVELVSDALAATIFLPTDQAAFLSPLGILEPTPIQSVGLISSSTIHELWSETIPALSGLGGTSLSDIADVVAEVLPGTTAVHIVARSEMVEVWAELSDAAVGFAGGQQVTLVARARPSQLDAMLRQAVVKARKRIYRFDA